MSRYDVVVLGGGIIGCALAEELARRGQRVAVLERGRIGSEASSAAAGILCSQGDLTGPDAFFELCQQARSVYPRWIARLQRRAGVDVDFCVRGVLHLATAPQAVQAMEQRARWQRRLGLRIERWSRREVRRREPAFDGRFLAGFFFPAEAEVDNVALMRALAVACRKAGAALHERATVRRVLARRGAVRGVETDRARYEAPIVVNCLGAWAPLGRAFPLPASAIVPARGQMLAFQGPRRVFHRPMMSDRGYLIQRADGRITIGSTVEIGVGERALTAEGMHAILSGLRSVTSALDPCAFVDSWVGFRPYSQDGWPLLGATALDGLYLATGHFRHGILLAPVTAQLMADLILHRRPRLDLAPFSPARFNS